MIIHIVGGGPAGIALSWILADYHSIHLYEKGSALGGSWKESLDDIHERKLHAHRIIFKHSSPFLRNLLSEMNIDFHSHFIQYNDTSWKTIQKHISVSDLLKLFTLPFKHSQNDTVHEFSRTMSQDAQNILNALCLSMDGVNSQKMSTSLFVNIIQNVFIDLIFGSVYTQKHSGYFLFDEIEKKLTEKGIQIHTLHELTNIDTHNRIMNFNGMTDVVYETCCICLDPKPLSQLFNEFSLILKDGTYGSICVMFYFDIPIELKRNSLHFTAHTSWNIIVDVLPDEHTICCVICDMYRSNKDEMKPVTTIPSLLIDEIWSQLLNVEYIPQYSSSSFGVGSHWDGSKWIIEQTGYSNKQHIPYKYNDNVFICGTMSERTTPYGSFESSVESSSILAHKYFSIPIFQNINVFRLIFVFILFLIVITFCNQK